MDSGGGVEKFRLTNFSEGGSVQDESTIINRMMLRFRPIAPKPAAGVDSAASRPLPKVRTKRKYVRVSTGRRKTKKDSNNNNNNDHRPERSGGGEEEEEEDRTLQLLPAGTAAEGGRSEVETWVTAEEGVVEECMERNKVRGKEELEEDTCPVFVSDGEGKVVWVNEAYREMVEGGGDRVSKVTVRLVVAEKLRPYLESYLVPFSCWVGLRFRVNSNSNNKEWKWWYMRVPCDVWKMEEHGFAWRLDLKVALKLGL
ncbi:hypothetical protein LINGRAHAP2_LOCUS34298 [Linum grandiflorum]